MTIGTASAPGTIADDEAPVASIAVTTQGDENSAGAPTDVVFTVSLVDAGGAPVTNETGAPLTFAISDDGSGSATSALDYAAVGAGATVSIADASSSGTFMVGVVDDPFLEATEQATVTIASPSDPRITLGTAGATADIADDDTAQVRLSVLTQGDEVDGGAPTDIVFAATLVDGAGNPLVNNTGTAITLDFDDAVSGDATAGSDYTAIPAAQTISIAAGASSGTVSVTVLDDTELEPVESLVARISNPDSPAVTVDPAAAEASATIADDDQLRASLGVTVDGAEDPTAPTAITFTVTLVDSLGAPATNTTGAGVSFDLVDALSGTATSGVDYAAIAAGTTIDIAAGAASGSVSVSVDDDSALEGTETVTARIENPTNSAVVIAGATATANIADDDSVTANLSVTTQGDENAAGLPTNVVYTVTLVDGGGSAISNDTGVAITFDIADTGTGTATAASDYSVFVPGAQVTIAPGQSSGDFVLAVSDDALLETSETVAATIANPSNASVTIGTATQTAGIADDETALARLSVTTPGAENNTGSPTDLVYTVALVDAAGNQLTNNTDAAIDFAFSVTGGTALSGTDFTPVPGTAVISIGIGEQTGSLAIGLIEDALLEVDETVNGRIAAPANPAVTLDVADATGTIVDDDAVTANLSVTTQGAESNGGSATDIVYTVTLVDGSGTPVVNRTGAALSFSLSDPGTGTASSGADYAAIAAGASIDVADGASSGSFTVAVTDDARFEGDETLDLRIADTGSPGVSLGTVDATATITDDEVARAVLTATNGDEVVGGLPTDIVFTVTLRDAGGAPLVNDTGADITVELDDLGTGTATSGLDYDAIAASARITIPRGASSGSFDEGVSEDALVELAETVDVGISSPSNADVTIDTAAATASIVDDDFATANLSATSNGAEGTPSTDIVYTVVLVDGAGNALTNGTGAPLSFDFDVLPSSTATAGSDYTAVPATARIAVADGASSGSLTVAVLDDSAFEGDESLDVAISDSSSTAVTIGTANAQATISDNDAVTANLVVTTQGDENAAGAPVDIVLSVVLEDGSGGAVINNTGGDLAFAVTDLLTGTASGGNDYAAVAAGAQIIVPAGQNNGVLTVAVSEDNLLEATETVQVQVSAPANPLVTLGTSQVTANIGDDDSARANLSVATQGDENSAGTPTDVVFAVSLVDAGGAPVVNDTGTAIAFDFARLSGSATPASDFAAIAAGARIEVAAGASTGTFTVAVTEDALFEADETLSAGINNPSNTAVAIDSVSAEALIIDDETVTANLLATTSGNEVVNGAPTAIGFTVELVDAGGNRVVNNTAATIDLDLADLGTGSALAGSDYDGASLPARLSIPVGDSSATFSVTVLEDTRLEADESVVIGISNPSDGDVALGAASAAGTILDDDRATADLSVTAQGAERNAGAPDAVEFTVTLNAPNDTGVPIAFDLSATGGSAAAADYDASVFGGQVITVGPGASTGSLLVPVLEDALIEGTETLIATLSNPSDSALSIGAGTATARIVDDEAAQASIVATDASATENPADSGQFTVTLDRANATGAPLVVTYSVSGRASGGADFRTLTGQVAIADGASTATIDVVPLDDNRLENAEDVVVTLTGSTSTSVGVDTSADTATVTITDDDTATVNVSILDVTAGEGGPNAGRLSVNLTKPNDTAGPIEVSYALSGSATPGGDYQPLSGTVSIPVGANNAVIDVTPIDDALIEGFEGVTVSLTGTNNAAVTPAGATSQSLSIVDNDFGTIGILATDSGAAENATPSNPGQFTLVLSETNNTGSSFTVPYSVTGTAESGNDFTALPGIVTVPAGADSVTIDLDILDDQILEAAETVVVTLTNSGSGLYGVDGANASATVTIADDDVVTGARVSITASDAGAVESPLDTGEFRVSLDKVNDTGGPITITYTVDTGVANAATPGSDYAALGGSVVIPAGNSSATIAIVPVDDGLIEPAEQVVVTLAGASEPFVTVNAAADTAAVQVSDDDFAIGTTASVSATDPDAQEGTANTGSFEVLLSSVNSLGAPLEVQYTVAGTANPGTDYQPIGGRVSIPDGSDRATITVITLDDTRLEIDESVTVTLVGTSEPTIGVDAAPGAATASVNIIDNEPGVTASIVAVDGGAGESSTPDSGRLRIDLSSPNETGADITVNLSVGGGATPGIDYTALPSSVTIPDGASTAFIDVDPLDDSLFEGTEGVTVTLTSTDNARVGINAAQRSAGVVIGDDEFNATTPVTVVANAASASEGGASGQFTVSLGRVNDTVGPITITYSVAGSADGGDGDYTALPGTVVIPVGQQSTTIDVTVSPPLS